MSTRAHPRRRRHRRRLVNKIRAPEERVLNISELFILRPVMTAALTASVILFGIFAYFRLPVSDLPAVDYPVIQVQVSYPGATRETMANDVATPLVRHVMHIPELDPVTADTGRV